MLAYPVWNKAQVTQSGSCTVRGDPTPCQRTAPQTGFNHSEYHHRISIEGEKVVFNVARQYSGQHPGTSEQQVSSPGTTTGWQIILGSRKSANHARAYHGSNKCLVPKKISKCKGWRENAWRKLRSRTTGLWRKPNPNHKGLRNEMQKKKWLCTSPTNHCIRKRILEPTQFAAWLKFSSWSWIKCLFAAGWLSEASQEKNIQRFSYVFKSLK